MYDREIEGKEYSFGVSGLLYRANVLMYDRQTETLWSQAKRKAVAGPLTGTELKVHSSTLTSWKKWRLRHPGTEVLSPRTGHSRDYSKDPYSDYYQSRSGFFSFFTPKPGEEEKELMVGIEHGGQAKAYPLPLLRQKGELRDALGGQTLTLNFDAATDRIRVTDGQGGEVPHLVLYWFVWKGIFPETDRFREEEGTSDEKK